MNKLITLAMAATLLASGVAYAQSQNQSVAGTYTLSSIMDHLKDGKQENPWGEGVGGSLMLAPNGRFSVQIGSAHRDKNASKSPRTPVPGYVAYFGTYTLGRDGKSLTYHVEGSSFPAWEGGDRKVTVAPTSDGVDLITTVTGDAQLGDFTSHQQWKRIK